MQTATGRAAIPVQSEQALDAFHHPSTDLDSGDRDLNTSKVADAVAAAVTAPHRPPPSAR